MLPDRSDIQSILDSVPDRRVSGFQLNSLRLPPSPSLEIPAHQQSSLELFHALSFAPSGSRGCSEEPISWHLCSQASAQTSSPISFEGLESSSIEYRHQNSHSSLLLSTGFSSSESAAYNIALMTSSGLETPPGSARSSMTELDRQPHPYTHPPTALHGDYLSPNDTMYPPPRDHGRGAPRDIPYPTYNTSTHQSHGGHSPNSRYLYTPYGLESRPPLPNPFDHRNELPSLPWPPTALPRRYPEPIPPIGGHPSHDPWADSKSPGHIMREAPDSGYRCSSARCRFTASSQEQLTRHQQKHLKIHYCRFTPCPRTEGFATPNDRERHEKSIHKIPGCYWKCLDNNCGSYGKEFSRRDNLKDHLKRMHPVPEGMSENEASALRSRLADTWRFDKGSYAEAAGR